MALAALGSSEACDYILLNRTIYIAPLNLVGGSGGAPDEVGGEGGQQKILLVHIPTNKLDSSP